MTRKLVALLGELLIIAAALLGLFLVYQTWFSNIRADIASERLARDLELEWAEQVDAESSESISSETAPPPTAPKRAIGLLYIPKLQVDVWKTPIISDVSYRALAMGVGHYPTTALPGEKGNFAIAGHRATNGEPFAKFEKLAVGDLVYVQTKAGFFTYELFENKKIQENEVWVLDRSPKALEVDSEYLMTLTSCDPRWNSTRRWAWWGKLVDYSKERPLELTK